MAPHPAAGQIAEEEWSGWRPEQEVHAGRLPEGKPRPALVAARRAPPAETTTQLPKMSCETSSCHPSPPSPHEEACDETRRRPATATSTLDNPRPYT